MTWCCRALVGLLLTVVAIAQVHAQADTVQLTLRDGRLSLVATNATPSQIFEAWSRAGGVRVVNAERMPSTPLSLTLDRVPEEQALDTLLRTVSGYLAVRRATGANPSASVFDRIVILATPVGAAPAVVAVPQPAAGGTGRTPVFAPPRPPAASQPTAAGPSTPQGIPQGPGVIRLLGPDGQPVEDDQAGAPPPPFNPGDAPDGRGPMVQQPRAPVQPPPQQPQPPSTSAPAGVPRPGMIVPAPAAPGQPGARSAQPR